MFRKARHESSERSVGGPAKLVVITAAFTLLASGTALASGSTSSQTGNTRAPAAHALLRADSLSITEAETKAETKAETTGSTERTDPSKPNDAAKPNDADRPDTAAQGVHGACVSPIAQDRSTAGAEHGVTVAEAAHACAGSNAADGQAKAAEQSADGQAKAAEQSADGQAKAAEQSAVSKATGSKKTIAGQSHQD